MGGLAGAVGLGTCRRPVVVQGEAFNRSRIATVVCVPLTSNLRWAEAPGNVLLTSKVTGLPRDSVANVSQLGKLSKAKLEVVLFGIDVVLGR